MKGNELLTKTALRLNIQFDDLKDIKFLTLVLKNIGEKKKKKEFGSKASLVLREEQASHKK